jgi:hypothetical protein
VSLTRYSLEAAYPLVLCRRKLFVRLEAECSVGVLRRLFCELQLLITVVFAANFSIVMLASGVRQKVVRAWLSISRSKKPSTWSTTSSRPRKITHGNNAKSPW